MRIQHENIQKRWVSFLEVSWTNLKSHKSRLNCSLLCPCSCNGIGCKFCNFNFLKQTRRLIKLMISMVLPLSTTQIIYYTLFWLLFYWREPLYIILFTSSFSQTRATLTFCIKVMRWWGWGEKCIQIDRLSWLRSWWSSRSLPN